MTQTDPPVRTVAGPVRGTYRMLLLSNLRPARWALGLIVVIAAIVIAAIARFGEVETSVVAFVRQGVIWFPFSLALVLVITHLPVHVAMGLTRRSLGRATLLVTLTTSALYAVAVVALLQLERAVYHLAGWAHRLPDDFVLAADGSQVGLLLGEYFVVAAAGQLCGLFCGVVYYRLGGWWGTLALPLTVGPVFLVIGLGGDLAGLPENLAAGTVGGSLVRGALLAGVLAAVALGYRAVLRTTPIQSVPLV